MEHPSHQQAVIVGRRRLLLIVAVCIVVVGSLIAVIATRPRQHPFRFIAFDVGQGDALFAETPDGHQLLVDGGPSNAVLAKLGRAMPMFDRSIDAVVMTHPDADHITGLVEVVRRYRIGVFLTTGVVHDTPIYNQLQTELTTRHVPIRYVHAGDALDLRGATFRILAPRDDWKGKKADDTNSTSILGRLDYQSFSVMLTGDAEASIEEALVQSGAPLTSTMLKLGHHGSRTSNSVAFLDAVRPQEAVLSVGKDNRYGHPHQEVLDRLAARRIPVDRTDMSGDLVFFSLGSGFTLKTGLGFRLF